MIYFSLLTNNTVKLLNTDYKETAMAVFMFRRVQTRVFFYIQLFGVVNFFCLKKFKQEPYLCFLLKNMDAQKTF